MRKEQQSKIEYEKDDQQKLISELKNPRKKIQKKASIKTTRGKENFATN